jgi:hypothetical protein
MDRPYTAPHLNGQDALAALAAQDWQAPYDFAGYEARLRRSRERAALMQKLGVASLVCVGLAVIALLLVTGSPGSGSGTATGDAPLLSTHEDPGRSPSTVIDERWLIALPAEPALARSSTRVPISALEDRIAWLDDSLSAALQEPAMQADVPRMHAQRRQLVDALVRVRYAEQLSTQFH